MPTDVSVRFHLEADLKYDEAEQWAEETLGREREGYTLGEVVVCVDHVTSCPPHKGQSEVQAHYEAWEASDTPRGS